MPVEMQSKSVSCLSQTGLTHLCLTPLLLLSTQLIDLALRLLRCQLALLDHILHPVTSHSSARHPGELAASCAIQTASQPTLADVISVQ